MAESKNSPEKVAEVTQTADDSPGGVEGQQVKPTADQSAKEVKASLVNREDADLHPGGLPDHPADQTPYPVADQPPLERPPVATGRPDVPIVQSLVTGAGAHTPPDPDDYHPDGRPRTDANP